MQKFWNWVDSDNDGESRTLVLEGTIAQESWFDDEVSPAIFRNELNNGTGNITVKINSPGGDCVAASQIYTMLKEYNGEVTVVIDGMAASAASVIAMAGDKICMSPTSLMMVHNPLTGMFGNRDDLQKAIDMLDEVKESIVNAYEMKTGLSRVKLSHLMDEETWMNAKKALELGFCDEVMFAGAEDKAEAYAFSAKVAVTNLVSKMEKAVEKKPQELVKTYDREKRLNMLKYL